MKKTIFAAIALAVATMPLTFAAQTPKANAPAHTASVTGKTNHAKKHHARKHLKKSAKPVTTASSVAPVKK